MAPLHNNSNIFTIYDAQCSKTMHNMNRASRTKVAWAPKKLKRQDAIDMDDVPVLVLSVDRIESDCMLGPSATVTVVDEVNLFNHKPSTSDDTFRISLDVDASKVEDCGQKSPRSEDFSSTGSLISVKDSQAAIDKKTTLCSVLGIEIGILGLVTSITLTGALLIVLCL
uniref:Uncharacterized protein n=1 Tax=Romanomermis culicivorax TaxID=13658 RepID=A0A915I1R3_ROMCU